MRRTFKEDAKMSASAATQKHDFIGLLAAPGRSPEIPEENDVYGWLSAAGNWRCLTKQPFTSSRCTSKAKSTSDGCSKDALFKMYGSCRAYRSATPTSPKRTTCTAPRSASGTHRSKHGAS